MPGDRLRVLVANGAAITRAGITAMLDRHGIEVVGATQDGQDTATLVAEQEPDVVILDFEIPPADSGGALHELAACPVAARYLVLIESGSEKAAQAAFAAGAHGFVCKDIDADGLVGAVLVIHAGYAVLGTAALRRLATRPGDDPRGHEEPVRPAHPLPPPSFAGGSGDAALVTELHGPTDDIGLDRLTQREREVLDLVAQGYSNNEIADLLTVSVATAKTHVSRVLSKLGLQRRAQVSARYSAGRCPLTDGQCVHDVPDRHRGGRRDGNPRTRGERRLPHDRPVTRVPGGPVPLPRTNP